MAQRYPAKLYAKTGRAHIVGITGPPGVGKSSLIDRLIEEYPATEEDGQRDCH